MADEPKSPRRRRQTTAADPRLTPELLRELAAPKPDAEPAEEPPADPDQER
jgi:hypothetical protein